MISDAVFSLYCVEVVPQPSVSVLEFVRCLAVDPVRDPFRAAVIRIFVDEPLYVAADVDNDGIPPIQIFRNVPLPRDRCRFEILVIPLRITAKMISDDLVAPSVPTVGKTYVGVLFALKTVVQLGHEPVEGHSLYFVYFLSVFVQEKESGYPDVVW
jgi:hypothetical protein